MEIGEECNNYGDTKMFLQNEEIDSWGIDEAISGYLDWSLLDGGGASVASKNIVSERTRRRKLNERLFALRAVVPNISRMDKASIVKDAINYIQELHEQERRIKAEIVQINSGKLRKNPSGFDDQQDHQFLPVLLNPKRRKFEQQFYDSPPIQVLEYRVVYVREKTLLVSLTCIKRTDTMVKLCQVFESLKLKIITDSITTISGTLFKTLFIQADDEEKDVLKIKIETAIAALSDPQSPKSM